MACGSIIFFSEHFQQIVKVKSRNQVEFNEISRGESSANIGSKLFNISTAKTTNKNSHFQVFDKLLFPFSFHYFSAQRCSTDHLQRALGYGLQNVARFTRFSDVTQSINQLPRTIVEYWQKAVQNSHVKRGVQRFAMLLPGLI